MRIVMTENKRKKRRWFKVGVSIHQQTLYQVVDRYGFDGAVLEVWRELAGLGAGRSEKGRSAMHALISAVAAPLRQDGNVCVQMIVVMRGIVSTQCARLVYWMLVEDCEQHRPVDNTTTTIIIMLLQVVVLVIPPLLAFGEEARQQLEDAGYPVADDFLSSDYEVGGSGV